MNACGINWGYGGYIKGKRGNSYYAWTRMDYEVFLRLAHFQCEWIQFIHG